MKTLIAHLLILGVWIFNISSMIPQVLLNYRLKYGMGISDQMLLLNLNGFLCGLFYIYAVDLPLTYKILAPISCTLLMILIMQRILYSPVKDAAHKRFVICFALNMFLLILSAFYLYHHRAIADVFGWASLFSMTIYQIPQIVKIIEQRSTFGFSFSYVTLMTTSAVLETIAGIILGLPLIVKLNGVRAVAMYLIFALLFMWYPPIKKPKES